MVSLSLYSLLISISKNKERNTEEGIGSRNIETLRSSLSQSENSGRYGEIMLFVDRINQCWVKGSFPNDWG